jgi:hypothetical protein
MQKVTSSKTEEKLKRAGIWVAFHTLISQEDTQKKTKNKRFFHLRLWCPPNPRPGPLPTSNFRRPLLPHSSRMSIVGPAFWSVHPISILRNSLVGRATRLQAGRSGDRIPVGAIVPAPVQTGPEAFPGKKAAGAWR